MRLTALNSNKILISGKVCSCSPTERMAVAAEVAGSRDEAHFWRALPPTLATLRMSLPESFTQPPANLVLYTDPQTGISAYRRTSEDKSRFALESPAGWVGVGGGWMLGLNRQGSLI